jgi:hypothetical protein
MRTYLTGLLLALGCISLTAGCDEGGDIGIIADAGPVDGDGAPLPEGPPCYTGPEGTEDVGLCSAGVDTGAECTGEVLPSAETCDGQDEDCDGTVDEDDGGAALTESCYTGPMGTLGVGPCIGGTATCTDGSFGTCEAQILPADETCNGADEDCDATIDNGCPTAISTAAGGTSDPFGGSGGTEFSETCPTGQVLVGFKGRATSEIRQLQPVCGTLVLQEHRDSTPYVYTIVRTDANDGTAFGGASGGTFSYTCPENEVVSGISGKADTSVNAIAVACSSLSISGSPGAFTVSRVAGGSSSEFGGGGGTPFSFGCPGDEVAATVSGSADTSLISVAITCVSVGLDLL